MTFVTHDIWRHTRLVTGSGLSYFRASSPGLTLVGACFHTMRPFWSPCKRAACERHAQSLVSQCHEEHKKKRSCGRSGDVTDLEFSVNPILSRVTMTTGVTSPSTFQRLCPLTDPTHKHAVFAAQYIVITVSSQ